MEEFVKNFNEFKDFLNSKTTEHTLTSLVGEHGKMVLTVIKDKFNELGLNNSF